MTMYNEGDTNLLKDSFKFFEERDQDEKEIITIDDVVAETKKQQEVAPTPTITKINVGQTSEIKAEYQKIKHTEAPQEHHTTPIKPTSKSSVPVVEMSQVTERVDGRRGAISMAPMPTTKHVSASESKPQTSPQSQLFAGLKKADSLADKKEIGQASSGPVKPNNKN